MILAPDMLEVNQGL